MKLIKNLSETELLEIVAEIIPKLNHLRTGEKIAVLQTLAAVTLPGCQLSINQGIRE